MEKSSFTKNPPELEGCADLSSLIYLEEENVLHNLEIRFKRQTVYTAISKILISINPYEWLPFYTDELIKRYEENSLGTARNESLGPHCYEIAANTYNDMNKDIKSQSLIVCGESGSGKTESAKALMSFLAKTKSQTKSNINLSDAVLAVNPILEALGNAKTVMNNNSSRFGKFTKMVFTDYDLKEKESSSRLVGTVIDSYLLEKSRVIMQSHGERNFHIFFQLFHGSQSADFGLTKPEDFFYLTQSKEQIEFHTVPGQDDKKNFEEMEQSLESINVKGDIKEGLLKAIAAILHLGNILFEEEEKGITINAKSTANLEKFAELLDLDVGFLNEKLTKKRYKIMEEIVISPYSPEEAIDNRNSMAKSLYLAIFEWVIKQCNKELLLVKEFKDLRFIGILDVFGFESFVKNSFEQFCINFANERLQQLFSESLMITEQKEYLKEGIMWTPLKIPDNRSIMRLINKKPSGIFSQLESACNMPKGKPEIFVNNVFKENAKNKRISKVKPTKSLLSTLKENEKFCGFKIKHYADSVVYNCNEFLTKNTDRVSEEIFELFSSSALPTMKTIFGGEEKSKRKGPSSRQNIGDVFTKELDVLVKTLNKTSNFFVRCVNPNHCKSSTEFDYKHVKKQLRSGGLVQVLKVIKLGYPTRMSYKDLNGFREKIATHPILEGVNDKDYWGAMMAAFNVEEDKYQFGLTKVFFKANINFIEKIQSFDGELTVEMISKIRKLFVSRRLTVVNGLIRSFQRVWSQIMLKRLLENVTKSIIFFSSFKKGLDETRKIIQEEKIEKEKERLKQEKIRLEKERKEREEEEERQREIEAAIQEKKMIEEEEKRVEEERLQNEEKQRQKIEEIHQKEILMQQKEEEKRKEIEEERQRQFEETQKALALQREEEHEKMRKKKEDFAREIEETKRAKEEESKKLEEKITALKEEARRVLEETAMEKQKQAEKAREFEKSLREKIEMEREEQFKTLLEDSKTKTEEIDSKLNDYEETKRNEIEVMIKDNEKRMEDKKKEIDEYEKLSKERVEEFNKDNMKQFEQFKEITDENQKQMKKFIDDKLEEIEKATKQFEENKAKQEKKFEEKSEEIEFERRKMLNEIQHKKEIVESELEYKQKDLENSENNVKMLEEMYTQKLEKLKKTKKEVKSKESRMKSKQNSRQRRRKKSEITERMLDAEKSKLTNLNKLIEEVKESTKSISLVSEMTRNDGISLESRDGSISEALAIIDSIENQNPVVMTKLKGVKTDLGFLKKNFISKECHEISKVLEKITLNTLRNVKY